MRVFENWATIFKSGRKKHIWPSGPFTIVYMTACLSKRKMTVANDLAMRFYSNILTSLVIIERHNMPNIHWWTNTQYLNIIKAFKIINCKMIALSYRSHYTLSLENATSLSSSSFKHQINDGKYLLIQLDRCNRSSNQPFTHTLSKIMLKVIITHKGWTIIIKSSYKMSEQQINCYILIRYRQKKWQHTNRCTDFHCTMPTTTTKTPFTLEKWLEWFN